jgi:hypothetical protein
VEFNVLSSSHREYLRLSSGPNVNTGSLNVEEAVEDQRWRDVMLEASQRDAVPLALEW